MIEWVPQTVQILANFRALGCTKQGFPVHYTKFKWGGNSAENGAGKIQKMIYHFEFCPFWCFPECKIKESEIKKKFFCPFPCFNAYPRNRCQQSTQKNEFWVV